jgi:hypothetical protein
MRTTFNLENSLFISVKKAAAESGRTMTAIVEDALRQALGRRVKREDGKRLRLVTFRGKGLQPGVDLDDSAALTDLMDRRDPA